MKIGDTVLVRGMAKYTLTSVQGDRAVIQRPGSRLTVPLSAIKLAPEGSVMDYPSSNIEPKESFSGPNPDVGYGADEWESD